jgi:hypothetical protein
MILPTKRITGEASLLGVGAQILRHLDEPMTISRLWNEVRKAYNTTSEGTPITFDWFVLGLDLLYALGTINSEAGRIQRQRS